MGKRGPAPTPTNLLKLRGSWRADINDSEPKPEAIAPDKPDDLPAAASAVWDRLAVELELMSVLTRADGFALELLARTWGKWMEAERKIEEVGSVYPIKNPDGSIKYLQQTPWVAMSRNYGSELSRLLQQFGLTPSARSRITTAVKDEAPADPLEALLNRKKSG
tara:strand:- start:99 stop:590 length:492 start_codon:yes stop_codon:yes gene_type:complete